jgi:type IV secretion system protein VirD4
MGAILAFLWLVLAFGVVLLFLTEHKPPSKPPPELLNANHQGFVFGLYQRFLRQPQYYYKPENEDGHILVCGGAGSGKSSSIAIPSIKSWRNAIFAIDIKGELSAASTAKSKIFNPVSLDTHGFDPFYLLRESSNPAQDAKEIALALIQEPANAKDPFWIKAAQNLLTGLLLHYAELGVSFVGAIRETLDNQPVAQHVKYISECSPSVAAKQFMGQFLGMDSKVLSGIYAELFNHIVLFATDEHIIKALTCENIITPEDLEQGYNVFLSIPEDKLEQWQPLLTLITNQFLKHFERRPDKNAKPILFLLDEFPRLGKIDTVATALTTLRSKKITIALIIQSLAQLDFLYGRELRRVILDNCSYKAILGASDAETQDYFSRLVGTQTVVQQGLSTSFAPDEDEERGHTISRHEMEQRVIKPHEFGTLKDVVLLTPWGCFRTGKMKPVDSNPQNHSTKWCIMGLL